MTFLVFQEKLHELKCTCDINQRYHQWLAWWWKFFDRVLKVFVALVAVAALAGELSGDTWHATAVCLAAFAAVLAVFLNVVTFGETEKFYDELFRSWSDLRTEAETQQAKVQENESGDKVPGHLHERYCEMKAKQHSLNSKEPAPWRWLLRRCQEDNNESVWGDGIRKQGAVEAERKRRENVFATSSAVASVGQTE